MRFYDTESFGKFLRKIRKEKKLSLEDVSHETHLNPGSLSKMERGLILPSQDILEILGSFYSIDLNKFSFTMRFTYKIDQIMNEAETAINTNNTNIILNSKKELNHLKDEINIDDKYIDQRILFLDASILLSKKNMDASLEKFKAALNITLNYNNISSSNSLIIFTEFEIRILLNIALLYNKLNYHQEHLDIMSGLYEYIINQKVFFVNTLIYSKIIYNVSLSLFRLERYNQAEKLINIQIRHSIEFNIPIGICLGYYHKALILSKNSCRKDESIIFFNKSITLAKIYQMHDLLNYLKLNKKNKNLDSVPPYLSWY